MKITPLETLRVMAHMKPQEYAIYIVCRRHLADRGTVHFDGQRIASEFASGTAATVYRHGRALENAGWFKLVSVNQTPGRHYPCDYRILSHKEWAAEHPGACDHKALLKEWRTGWASE